MAGSEIAGAEALKLKVGGLTFSAFAMGHGPLVILIHGFPDGPETFRHQLPALAEAGYRAVAVTARGYEASSRPDNGNYSIACLADDVLGWIDALGEHEAHLIGHDWGANLAFAAARAAPERVKSLTLMAVPHPARLGALIRSDPAQMRRSSYIFFFQLRGIADLWVRMAHAAFIERLWRKWSPGWKPEPDVIGPVRDRFSVAAMVTAALGYYRQIMDTRHPDARRSAELFGGIQTVRTLGVAGEQDGCISADIFERSMLAGDFSGGMRVERLPGAGHFVHAERPDAVNPLLLDWLAKS